MKKIVFIFIYLFSVYSTAQTLHTDDKGVRIFYEIQQTSKFTFCQGNSASNKNFSKEKINIWKVTMGIKNGYSESIVPRGVGIANISVSSDPIKPYSHDYCNYKYVKNYEPNTIQRHLDQSLFIWSIRDYKVEEIKPNEVIENTTYLYLYEGQTPKLTNWQFLGYRLKKDFKPYNPTVNNVVIEPKPVLVVSNKAKEKAKTLEVSYNNKINEIDNNSTKVTPLDITINKKIEVVEDENMVDGDSIAAKEIKVTNSDKNKTDSMPVKCPGEKALKYKEKFNSSSDFSEQRAYSWLALYYTYKCECEMGSPRSDQLVPMINNVVDSYTTNTNNAYGKISKVNKCKAPVVN